MSWRIVTTLLFNF